MVIPKIEKIKSKKVDFILKLIKVMNFSADEYDELADNCNEKYLLKTVEL